VTITTPRTDERAAEAWKRADEWVRQHATQVQRMAARRGLDVEDAASEIRTRQVERMLRLQAQGREANASLLGLFARDAVAELADRSTLRPSRSTRNSRRRRWDAKHCTPTTEAEARERDRAAWSGAAKVVATDVPKLQQVAGAATPVGTRTEWATAAMAVLHDRANADRMARVFRAEGEGGVRCWLEDWACETFETMPASRREKLRAAARRQFGDGEVRPERIAAWGREQVAAAVQLRDEWERAEEERRRERALQRERGELPPATPVQVEWDEHGLGRLVFDDLPTATDTSRPKRAARTAVKAAKTRDNRPAPAMVSLFEAFPQPVAAPGLELRPA